MSNYRRVRIKGGCYFFTVITHNRNPIFKTTPALARLHDSFMYTRRKNPFRMDAYVFLPDHIHCIWTLPDGDADYSTRWRLLKSHFSIGARKLSPSFKGAIWQPRFWEHAIRNHTDYRQHLDYIHYNPVKHGYVVSPAQWPNSSFKEYVERGFYDKTWGGEINESIMAMDME